MNFNSGGSLFPVNEEPDNEYMWLNPPFSSSSNDGSLYSDLHEFESTMRCFICKEFLQSPVSLVSCHHSFCSYCIRIHIKQQTKGMTRTPTCPLCKVKVPSKDENKCLEPNRTLETLVQQYRGLRPSLSSRLISVATGTASSASQGDDAESMDKSSQEEPQDEVQPRKRPRRTTRSEAASQVSSPSSAAAAAPPQQKQQQRDGLAVKRLERIRPTVYSALNRKKLAALCEKVNLSTRGTEQDLRDRHEAFVKLWNAQCDSFHNDKTQDDIARQVMKREETRKAHARESKAYAAPLERLKENRKELGNNDERRVAETIESGDAKFDAEFKANFARLIADGPKRRKRKWTKIDYDLADQVALSSRPRETAAPEETAAMAVACDASMPAGGVDDTHQQATADTTLTQVPANPYSASKSRSNIKVPPKNPYSDKKPSATGTNSGDKKESPLSAVPDKNLFHSKLSAASTWTASAQKPSRGASLMDFGIKVTAVPKQQPSMSQQTTNSSVSSSQQSTSNRPSICGPWDCVHCTFHNEKNLWSGAKCEMCNKPRVAPPTHDEVILLDV